MRIMTATMNSAVMHSIHYLPGVLAAIEREEHARADVLGWLRTLEDFKSASGLRALLQHINADQWMADCIAQVSPPDAALDALGESD